jgi:tRNA threonylcarbamoyladenosine biosynthesis protein TsaE
MDIEVYNTTGEEGTNQLGTEFSRRLKPGDLVAFYGELGAGKTEFIKGVCDGMRVEEIVSSPTYTIINQYVGLREDEEEIILYHIDLYRIESPGDLGEIGLEEILAHPSAIKLIEWASHADMLLPSARYDIHFHTIDDNTRRIEIVHRDAVPVESSGTHRLLR